MVIRIYFGLNGSGKTYLMTDRIVDLLLKIDSGKKKYRNHQVFSNYPVIYKKSWWGLEIKKIKGIPLLWFVRKHKILSPSIWISKDMQKYPITNASIFIDEAYEMFDSRQWKLFTTNDMSFFTKHRHNDLNFHFALARAEGLDTVLRNLCQYWYHCKSVKFLDRVFFFKVDYYYDLDSYNLRYKHKEYRAGKFIIRPKKKIYDSYDTKQYRRSEPLGAFTQWQDIDIDKHFKEVLNV